jgi:hypothetical protein
MASAAGFVLVAAEIELNFPTNNKEPRGSVSNDSISACLLA